MRVRSASWLLSAQAAALLIGLPTSILLARALGPAGKGTISIVQQVGTMGATLLNFGLGAALVYYSARREARGSDAVRLAVAVSAVSSLLLLAVFGAGGEWLAQRMFGGEGRPLLLLIGAAAVLPVLTSQLLNCYNVGSGAIRRTSLVNVAALLAQLIGYVALLLSGLLTAATAVVVWLVVSCASAIAYSRIALAQPEGHVEPGPVALLRRAYRYGLAAWIGGSLDYASLRQDVFLLALFKGPAAVGVYSIAVTLAELSLQIPSALNSVLTPKIAAEREAALEIALKVSRLTWPVTLAVGLSISALAVPLVPLVFGVRFEGSLLPLALLIPGMIAYAMGAAPGAFVRGMGHPRDWTIASGVNVAANLGANLMLIPRYGAVGAALASSISYSAMAAVGIGFFLRRSGASVADTIMPRREDVRQLGAALVAALRERFRR